MCREWIRKQMDFYYGNTGEKGQKLYAFGPLEITLIVVAVILVFGVGKLANVGGALGKSIREFRREKDKIDDAPKLTTKENQENKSEDESKD